MNEKFNFRGPILEKNDFYMLAVLKKDEIHNFVINNSENFSELGQGNKDKYFFLCQNQYRNRDGDIFQRLYWSSDPDDFQKSKNENHLNQGVVRVNCNTVDSQSTLRYRTTFSNSSERIPEPGQYRNFGINLGNLTGEESSFNYTFYRNKGYNLNNNNKYYSVPYTIKTDFSFVAGGVPTHTGNEIDWVFRKIIKKPSSSSEPNVTVPKPTTANGSSFVYNFVDVGSMDTAPGTSDSYFNYGSVKYVHLEGMSTVSDFFEGSDKLVIGPYDSEISNFPQHFSDVRIENESGTSRSVIYYDSIIRNNDQAEFILNDATYSRGLLAEDFEISSGTSVKLTMNLRNDPDCFCKLSTTSDFNSYFDIYLLPVEEDAIFPGGHLITNHPFFPICDKEASSKQGGKVFTPLYDTSGLTSPNLSFYNDRSRLPFSNSNDMTAISSNNYISDDCSTSSDVKINTGKLNSYRKIYTLFFFNELGVLNPSIWSTTGLQAFPTIAKHASFPITFYTWKNWESARQGYMYDYCDTYNYCGFCYGQNINGGNNCYADHHTRKHAALTSSENILPPLATQSRYSDGNTITESQDPSDQYQIGFYVFLGLYILWIVVTSLIYHHDSSNDMPTLGSLNLFLGIIMLAVLVYMNSVISSINTCEKNQTASCPTFSNPNKGDDSNYYNYTYYTLPDGNTRPLLVDPYSQISEGV